MEVLSVLVVGSIVTYLMYQNINKITSNLELQKTGTFEEYAAFAAKVSEQIRKVKNDLDKDMLSSDPICHAKENCDCPKNIKALLDLLRETAFYETVMAKRKTPKEVEQAMADILSRFEAVILESCTEGEALAGKIRDYLHSEYQKIGR